jgi:hypothetical protein
MPLLGKVFRLTDQSVESHFWIIVSEPLDGKVLAVNVTDGANCPDSPCKLAVGDHPRITIPSAIIYRKAREFQASIIEHESQRPYHLQFFADATPELLEVIIAGARTADDLTAKLLRYLPPS